MNEHDEMYRRVLLNNSRKNVHQTMNWHRLGRGSVTDWCKVVFPDKYKTNLAQREFIKIFIGECILEYYCTKDINGFKTKLYKWGKAGYEINAKIIESSKFVRALEAGDYIIWK